MRHYGAHTRKRGVSAFETQPDAIDVEFTSGWVYRFSYEKTGAPSNALFYGDRAACTKYAMGTIELTKRYESMLTAKKG